LIINKLTNFIKIPGSCDILRTTAYGNQLMIIFCYPEPRRRKNKNQLQINYEIQNITRKPLPAHITNFKNEKNQHRSTVDF